MFPHSQDSQWHYDTLTLKSTCYNTGWWLRKIHLCVCVCVCVCVLCCVVLVLNIIAGLLNKETRGWIPGGQMLYMHWKAMLISSEYLIMERRLVLSKQNIQDISVDHGKLLHSQNWWKKSHWAALKIYFLFQKLGNFSKDLGLRLLSEFLAPGGSVVKNLPTKQETRGLIPGSGRPPGVENGNPLQYSCLGNPMNRGAWQATVHGFTKNQQDLAKQQQRERKHCFLNLAVYVYWSIIGVKWDKKRSLKQSTRKFEPEKKILITALR